MREIAVQDAGRDLGGGERAGGGDGGERAGGGGAALAVDGTGLAEICIENSRTNKLYSQNGALLL